MSEPERLLDALLNLPQVYGPELEERGRLLAWTQIGGGATPQVWARPAGGGAKKLSSGETFNFFENFLPGGEGVLYEADPGDERTALYAARMSGERALLSELHPPYYRRGAALHPERPWLFLGANYDFERKMTIEPTWVWRKDLKTGEHRLLAAPERAGTHGLELAPDGRHLLYDRQGPHPGSREVWVVDVEGRKDRRVLSAGSRGKAKATWTRDGRLFYLVEEGTARKVGLADPSGTRREVLEEAGCSIEGIFRLENTPYLGVFAVENARGHTLVLSPEGKVVREVRSEDGELRLLGVFEGDWVAYHQSSTRPADLVRLTAEGLESLTGIDARVPDGLVPAEDFFWKGSDGTSLHGLFYRAKGRPKGTIVLVHGGPTARAGRRLSPEVQYYLARGFHVFLPNYRGSTGYGLAFQEKIKETGWGGLEQKDIETGIEALIAAGLAELYRVGVTGTSYGGYSSWWQITHAPRRLVAAAAPICGMTDLVLDYETTRPDLRPYSEEMLGGSPEEVPERYRERSPIHYVDRIEGDLLIVQGALDPNVTPENVRAVEARLRAHGIPYEKLVFEDEGHGILKKENRRTLYRRLADFFERAFQK